MTATEPSTTMTALTATQFGPPHSSLQWNDTLALPVPSPTQLLIRVTFTDINPVDVQKLQGNKPTGTEIPRAPLIVGYGGSGVIAQIGSDAPISPHDDNEAPWQVGDRVVFLCDSTQPGSYATHVCVDSRLVCRVSPSTTTPLRLAELACLPVAGNTAYEALEKVGLTLSTSPSHAGAGQTLLIVGGSGGVGSWTTLLARALYPQLCICVTSSTPNEAETIAWCQDRCGATQVIGHDQITTQLPDAGRKGSVDYVVCLSEPTTSLFGALADIIKPFGQICLVVAGKGIQSLDLGFCFFKSATVHTETVFAHCRSGFARNPWQQVQQMQHMIQLMESQQIRAPLAPNWDTAIVGTMDWQQALAAAADSNSVWGQIASGHCRGKLVMKITD